MFVVNRNEYEERWKDLDLSEEEREAARKAAEALEEETKDLKLPDGLKPERIEKMLSAKKKEKRSRFLKYASIAAGAAVVLGISAMGLWGSGLGGYLGEQEAQDREEAASDGEAMMAGVTAEASIRTAEDYDEVFAAISAVWEDSGSSVSSGQIEMFGTEEADMAGSTAAAQGARDGASNGVSAGEETGGKSFSDTNTREEDVGEADLVKTDGSFLYIVNGRDIRIVDIRGEEMKDAGSIRLEGDVVLEELYVRDGKLVLFYNETVQTETDGGGYGDGFRQFTAAETFDVSDPQEPESLGKISQSGNYRSVRISDGYLYLFSEYHVSYGTQAQEREAYIPLVQGELMESSCIYMPEGEKGNFFLVATAFSLSEPDQPSDKKAVLSSGGECYVSAENIYVYEEVYDSKEDYDQTSIRKIAYKDGEMKGIARTKIWGHLKDSFCIDEYEGNLRVVTTVDPVTHSTESGISLFGSSDALTETVDRTSTNALYVLDEGLDVIGKIEKLAPDETVYSARFLGETGYFVTYEQVDPLFSVDLSDPEAPKVTGALKIPGFSEYLHPYGEGLLLGIGMDADLAGTTNGVKLSMFDISDPADVSEIWKEVLEHLYSADVGYDYKAALIDPERNLICFSASGDSQHYYVYSFDPEKGFTCLLDRELNGYADVLRGVYAEDTFYLVEGNAVEAFRLDTFEKTDDLVL